MKDRRDSHMARLHKKLQVEERSRVFARLADTFRRSDHLEEAIELCHRGLVHHPDYVSGHIVLGQCYLDLGRLEEARDSFVRALSLDEDNILTLRSLGNILFQQGELEEAAGHYRRALRLDPRNRDLQELLREAQAQLAESAAPKQEPAARESREEPPESIDSPADQTLSGAVMMSVPAFGREVLETTDTEEHRLWLREMTRETGPGSRDPAEDGPVPENGRPDPEDESRSRDAEPADSDPGSGGAMHDVQLSPEETQLLRDQEDEHPAKGPPRGMATATLAEIYFQQGYLDKAIEIYLKVLRHDTDDEKSRARLSELRTMRAGRSEAGADTSPGDSEGRLDDDRAGPETSPKQGDQPS